MEDFPPMHLTLNGEVFEATPQNTSLFTFVGELALYDHVFLQTTEDGGCHVFERLMKDQYIKMAEYMCEASYPKHLDLQAVADCDRHAFDLNVEAQLDDVEAGVPEGWVDGTAAL